MLDVLESQNGVTNIPHIPHRSSVEQAGGDSIESADSVAALHVKGLPISYLCSNTCPQGCS